MSLLLLLLVAMALILAILVSAAAWESMRPPRRSAGWALGRGLPADPGDLDVPFESWTLDRPKGVRLPVWDVAGLASDGPVLILLHGWGRSRLTWLPFLKTWRTRGRRILMIDLQGHGDATPANAALGDADVDDVVSLVERLALSEDVPLVVVGRSLGATVGILSAACCDRVDGVVAVAPYETLAVPLGNRIRLRGLPARPTTWLAIRLLALLGRRPRSTSKAARTLAAPLLIVQGDRDPISPVSDARRFAEEATDGRFELVEGAGHGDHWDLEPDRLDTAVDRLIADASTRRHAIRHRADPPVLSSVTDAESP